MTRPQQRLVGAVAAAAVIAGVVMLMLGMEPRLVLVTCIVMLTSTTALLVVGLARQTTPLHWYRFGTEADTSARPDRRVQILRSRMRRSARLTRTQRGSTQADEPIDEIIDSLIAAIDDHLDAEHGLDRSTDPAAASVVIGPELTRFVSNPSEQRSMTRGRTLARTVSLIEAL